MAKFNSKNLFIAQNGGKLYIETYGCQMNFGDSEVVVALLKKNGWEITTTPKNADLILVNTCAIRDNAEIRVWGRLKELKFYKKKNRALLIGVIGCMAERLKEKLIEKEKAVDIVVGPDAYRDIHKLVAQAAQGSLAINTLLSREETYAEITPVRLDKNGVSAFVSIMRGCNNFCSYCVVPYTRGIERSRPHHTIIKEVKELIADGYKEVTLLGQNVNSYKDADVGFHNLMKMVAQLSPNLRVRFSTSHPKDISNELINVVAQTTNICKAIHLPAQSGSTRMLEMMNRKYTREWYLDRIAVIKKAMPQCSITTDVIAGFCSETLQDHEDTLSLMSEVGYDFAYMYKYSMRPDTKAHKEMIDDVEESEKTRRLNEVIARQSKLSLASNKKDVGKIFEVLVEGESKRSKDRMYGRSSQNKVVVFDRLNTNVGDYVMVNIISCTGATLLGELV